MLVELQTILADLPQIFPGVQQIPLSRIHPNPDNPGPPISEDLIADLATNLEEVGLTNPIKVMPNPAKPLAEGVNPHPENPRLKPDGQPWEVGDFNWVILAGERRYRAFGRLKKEAIPAFILNPTPEEAVQITHLDNDVRQRGWWADYQSIEALKKANPNLSQGQVAVNLKMDRPKVNRALQLMPLLNPEARALACSNATAQNKGKWQLSEMAAAELAGLATDPVTPEAQDLAHRALAAVIDDQLTRAGVKNLVQWVKQGNQPESFGKAKSTGPKTSQQPEIPTSANPSTTKQQPEIPTSQNEPIGSAPRDDNQTHQPGGWLSTFFQKRPQATGLIASGLGGIVMGFLARNLKRAFGTLLRRYMIHALAVVGAILLFSPHLFVSLSHLVSGNGKPKAVITPVDAPKDQPANPEPVSNPPLKEGEKGGVRLHRTVSSKKIKRTSSQPKAAAQPAPETVDKTIPSWAQEVLPSAGDFANRFYGISYSNWADTLVYLKAQMTGTYAQAMVDQYFPPALGQEMQAKQLAGYFSAGQPAKVLRGEGDSAEVLVQGTLTTSTRMGRTPQIISTKPVALLLTFRHAEGIGSKIEKVAEVEPSLEKPAVKGPRDSNPNADLGKVLGNAAGAVTNAVNAGSSVKKLFGF